MQRHFSLLCRSGVSALALTPVPSNDGGGWSAAVAGRFGLNCLKKSYMTQNSLSRRVCHIFSQPVLCIRCCKAGVFCVTRSHGYPIFGMTRQLFAVGFVGNLHAKPALQRGWGRGQT